MVSMFESLQIVPVDVIVVPDLQPLRPLGRIVPALADKGDASRPGPAPARSPAARATCRATGTWCGRHRSWRTPCRRSPAALPTSDRRCGTGTAARSAAAAGTSAGRSCRTGCRRRRATCGCFPRCDDCSRHGTGSVRCRPRRSRSRRGAAGARMTPAAPSPDGRRTASPSSIRRRRRPHRRRRDPGNS